MKQRRGQTGDAKNRPDCQAQWMRLLGSSDDIKSKEYSTILLVLIYYWNAHRPGLTKQMTKVLTHWI